MKKYLLLLSLFIPIVSLAGDDTGWVNVLEVGGQGRVMFIKISMVTGGSIGCSNDQLRFPATAFDSPEDQARLYSAALSALARGSEMKFYLSHCNGSYPYFEGSDGFWWAK